MAASRARTRRRSAFGAHAAGVRLPLEAAVGEVGDSHDAAAARDPNDDLLIISTDSKGIVMRHEDLREGTRRAAQKSARKLETRLTPGQKSNRKRMAQVATVYSIAPFPRGPADILHSLRDADEVDAKRPRPTDKRVWASVEKSGRMVIRD
ncbi:MAG TPA: ISKra4 family transposase, partial [Labilithrix sp.]|nr:ISKra4 family transposase [Labilithrix sp.]